MLQYILMVPVHSAMAQDRLVQVHRVDEPEGRLIAFYAAAMVFSPLGVAGASAPGGRSLELGLEGTYLPRLSESQRRPGIDKPETTNLAPVLPRPRIAWRIGDQVTVEGSWVPPLRVGDARANLFAGAISRSVASLRGVRLTPRIAFVGGRVRGAITCNAATARVGDAALATYYLHVCHDHDSDDWFEPRLAVGEVVMSRRMASERVLAYASVGGRVDRTRFDIGVIRADGSRDRDHPILRLSGTRPHLAAGGAWRGWGRVRVAGEWFYAPGSISTVRAYAGWTP